MGSDITGQVILGRYRVDRFIEAGGMGAVYRIWDQARNVPLAMKVLHEDLKEDPSVWRMFQREADALKKLAHPHIVPFYGLFETPRFDFFLEHYVDGVSLKILLQQRKGMPLSLREALIILKALSAALGYAHINGIVHCDIKPGNVLLDQSGHVYLTDFGIARHALSTTTTLASAGTPAYMAPEQIGGEPVSPATDVYALGILLFEMLTGRRPFLGTEPESEEYGPSTDQRIYYAQLSLTPQNPARLNPGVPLALGQVVLKAMEKDPAQRFASTGEMLQAVCQAMGINPTTLPGQIGPEMPTKRVVSPPPEDIAPEKPDASQAAPARNRRRLEVLLAVGGILACLALGALGVLGAALWKNYSTFANVQQTSPATVLAAQSTFSPSKTPGQAIVQKQTATQTATATARPLPTDTIAPTASPAVPDVAAQTLTAESEGFKAPLYSPLPGCAASHIHQKDWAMITFGSGRNSLRSTPDTHPSNNKIGNVEPGELIYVIDGPSCNYGWLLWKVRTATGLEGWTPETDGIHFFLEPFPSWEACPNSPPSLLHKGDQAQVTLYPPLSNRVRTKPGLNEDKIGSIDPGQKLVILDGPECLDGFVWWRVRGENGVIGWTAEGENENYFLVPIPKKHS